MFGGEKMVAVHERMEQVRIKKGVTKTHIAKVCGHTPQWYYAISTGRRTPNVNSVQKIANALEVEASIFFKDELSDTRNEDKNLA